MAIANGTYVARIIPAIETKANRGDGTDENPSRIVTQYWSLDGKLLGEYDPIIEENRE